MSYLQKLNIELKQKPNFKNPALQNQKPKYYGATKLERWGSTLLEVTGVLSDFLIYARIINILLRINQ
jgi:hypothetical protein